MATESKLAAETRSRLGTAEARRLRRNGRIPGNVYGHGEGSLPISVEAEALDHVLHGGHRVVDLQIDGDTQKAMFREVQWDTWGVHIQHFDLLRVTVDERVEVEVRIELHGLAPGVRDGGVMDHHLRQLPIECLAVNIPEKIEVNINELQIGDSVHVRDLKLPEGVKLLVPTEELVLQINEPMEVPELEEEEEAAPAEPELVGEKKEEEGEGEEKE